MNCIDNYRQETNSKLSKSIIRRNNTKSRFADDIGERYGYGAIEYRGSKVLQRRRG